LIVDEQDRDRPLRRRGAVRWSCRHFSPRLLSPRLDRCIVKDSSTGGNTTVQGNKDGFTMTHKSDGLKIVAKGKVEGGKPNVTEVVIESNGKSKTYDSLDKVPAEYREKIQKLLGMGGAKDR
jgi:hypothetical protein